MTHDKIMRAVLVLLGSLPLVGCDEGWQAETYPVIGKVQINGQPAADAVVELRPIGTQPDSRHSRPWGVVQPDGAYQLTTYRKHDGAPPGEYALTLRWPSDLSSPSHFDRLAGAFDSPETAPLRVTIRPEKNTLPTVELTGAKILPGKKPVAGNIRKSGPGPRMAN